MKKAIFLFAMVIGLGSVTVSNAQVVSPDQVVELKGQEKEPTRGENTNIKKKKPTTDEIKKKDEKTRGTYVCDLKLENWSDYCMDVYIDGNYHCTLSPQTYLYTVISQGYSTIYSESCGGTRYWSKAGISCDDKFTYRFFN